MAWRLDFILKTILIKKGALLFGTLLIARCVKAAVFFGLWQRDIEVVMQVVHYRRNRNPGSPLAAAWLVI